MAANGLERVRAAIAASCRSVGRRPDELRLIAVTKQQQPTVLADLAAADQLDFGENRVEHLETMVDAAPPGARFHYIGRVQSRQFARIVPLIDSLHSLAEPRHVDKLDRVCRELDRRLAVFLQVNTSGEAQKAGCPPTEVAAFLDRCRATTHLDPVGLMCMAPDLQSGHAEDAVRRCFAACRELADKLALSRLSMGMSGDFPIAIAEGATDLRIGSVLFA